jgi:hypothetical protein
MQWSFPEKRVLKSCTMLTFSGWTAIVAAEAGFFDVLVQYWALGEACAKCKRGIDPAIRKIYVIPRNGECNGHFRSNIGSGVFIATGKALATGGPGNMLIAYAMVCS